MNIFRDPDLSEIIYVATHMREKSQDEMFAATSAQDGVELAMRYFRSPGFRYVAYGASGKPAAILGATALFEGVWGLFGFGTDEYDDIIIPVTKFARREMMADVKEAGARRAQCFSPASHEDTHKWLRFLGAKEEARLKNYTKDGDDMLVFAWLRED